MLDYVDINDKIPDCSCVYFLFNDVELIYIGQTKNLRGRMKTHNVANKKLKDDNDLFNCVYYLKVNNFDERLSFEKEYILMYEPKYNGDGKFIESNVTITVNDNLWKKFCSMNVLEYGNRMNSDVLEELIRDYIKRKEKEKDES